jgi:DNA-binding phage protein
MLIMLRLRVLNWVMEMTHIGTYRWVVHRTLLRYRGRELVALAARAGLSRAVVYRLRSDPNANPRFDTLRQLEHALGMELDKPCPSVTSLEAA